MTSIREKHFIRGRAFFCECGDHAWGALDKGLTTMVSPVDSHWLSHVLHGAKVKGAMGRQDVYAAFSGPIADLYKDCPKRGPGHLHRAIMQALPSVIIDHASRDKLDNRRPNLRKASVAQNSSNTTLRTPSSGYRGVGFNRHKTRYHAGLTVDGKYHYVGTFDTTIEAALARDAAAIRLHGAFAVLNYPADPTERRKVIMDEIGLLTARVAVLREEIASCDAALTIEMVTK